MKYKIAGKIIEAKGKCPAGHVVGEAIDLTLENKKGVSKGIKLCPYFFYEIYPFLFMMENGGQYSGMKDPNSFEVYCSEEEPKVRIKVKRTPVKEKK